MRLVKLRYPETLRCPNPQPPSTETKTFTNVADNAIVARMAPEVVTTVCCVAGALGVGEAFEKDKADAISPQDLTDTASPVLEDLPLVDDHTFSLRVGNGKDIPRWEKGSILTYSVDSHSFPRSQDHSLAGIAEKALEQAIRPWNDMNLGITLEPAMKGKTAVFDLVFSPNNSNSDRTLARAFPPDAPIEDRKLVVYARQFDPVYVDSMANTFLHEIGHILGLRHEFEEKLPSILFGEANALSVMNYLGHPSLLHIQQTDLTWTKEFYAFNGRLLSGLPIKDISAKRHSKAW